MHEDEVVASIDQVRRLIDTQFPRWRDLPLRPVAEHGTDHLLYRLGEDHVVRMPRASWAVDQAASDARWLPVLAPHLPVAVPAPVAVGEPGEGYPWVWSVAPWLPGRTPAAYDEGLELVEDLAGFVRALRAIDGTGGPAKEAGMRGASLAHIDDAVREAIVACGDRVDAAAVTAVWDDAVSAPEWAGPPTWLHGDLLPGNLLVGGGDDPRRLSAVIDFGALGVGDPAPDLQPAWKVLPPAGREDYLVAVGADEAMRRRGRGWALGPALTGIPYYWDTVPAFARSGLTSIAHVLEEFRAAG